MFLIIMEDGEVFHTATYQDGDKDSAEEGILDLVDISDPSKPVSYYDGEWHPLRRLVY